MRLEITSDPGTEEDWNQTLDGRYLFAGTSDMTCSGEQSKTVECDAVDCNVGCYPRDCLFGAWNEWSEPHLDYSRGLSMRSFRGLRAC